MPDSVVGSVVVGGIGATLGGIVTALIQVMSRKSESRAKAADIVADAAGGLADRLNHFNESLFVENRALRQALLALAVAVDEAAANDPLTAEVVEALRHASSKAREAL